MPSMNTAPSVALEWSECLGFLAAKLCGTEERIVFGIARAIYLLLSKRLQCVQPPANRVMTLGYWGVVMVTVLGWLVI
jgi:hypothetical protein